MIPLVAFSSDSQPKIFKDQLFARNFDQQCRCNNQNLGSISRATRGRVG